MALWGVGPEELASFFPDFREASSECRFRSCAHMEEPDCGVRDAVSSGSIRPSRYASYRVLKEELEREAG